MGFDMTDEEYLRQNNKQNSTKPIVVKNKAAQRIETIALIYLVLTICSIVLSIISFDGATAIVSGVTGVTISLVLYGLAEIINLLQDIKNSKQ